MEKLRFKEFISDSNSIKYINLKDALLYTKSDDKEENSIKYKNDNYKYKLYSPKGHIGYSKLKVSDNKFIGLVKWGSGAGNTILCEAESSVVWTMGALITQKNYSIKYFFYKLNYQFFHKFISTSTTPNLYYNEFSEELIQTPSYAEQEKIGGFLSTFDNLIDKQQDKIGLLIELKKGYLQKMFPKNDANVPEIRFKGFTDAWEQRKLGDMAESFEYGLNASAMEYDGINKYLRITDIDEGTRLFKTSDLTSPNIEYNGSDNYLLKKGDILFARTGASVGKSYIFRENDGKVYFAGFLIRARIMSNYSPQFIYQTTLRDEYSKKIMITSQRSGQPGVNAKEYSSFEFMIPSYEEQMKIGEHLEKIDHLITLHQRKLSQLENLKKGHMQRLFA
jgi:type I restriction enzyme S subunit